MSRTLSPSSPDNTQSLASLSQNIPNSGSLHTWHSLGGAARANVLVDWLEQNQRFALLVTKDSASSQEWLEQIQFFSAHLNNFSVFHFADQEILPYDHFSPHPDIASDRLSTLYQLQQASKGICIVSAQTFSSRLCPKSYVNQNTFMLEVGKQINAKALIQQLDSAGYHHCENVYQHGEYAIRGSLIDIYPMGSTDPIRIELFDDEIESLRHFDTETQRSTERCESIAVLPAGEVCLDKAAINLFRDRWHEEFHHDPDICPIYQDTLAAIASPGIENYLPMFHTSTASLLDFLPSEKTGAKADSIIISFPELEEALSHHYDSVTERYTLQAIDATRPLLKPEKLFCRHDEIFSRLKHYARINITHKLFNKPRSQGFYPATVANNPDLTIDSQSDAPFAKIEDFISSLDNNQHVLFCVETLGRREIFIENLQKIGISALTVESWFDFTNNLKQASAQDSVIAVTTAAFNQGSYFPAGSLFDEQSLHIFAEPELFGVVIKPKVRQSREKNQLAEATIHNLIELRDNAPIVHIDHGVGRYRGLVHLDTQGIAAEFLCLEYAGGDKLYVPVTSLHLISRYMGGDEATAPMNKLGSEQWRSAKQKAIKNVHDVAAELLDIYARRESQHGFGFHFDQSEFDKFCDQFPFEETPDQLSSVAAVIDDMQNEKPMDRLICGDVGFGKTEVAMRATFIAASNSKQVLVLVPTTLLAQQHAQNFQDRFASWPISVDVISRFRSAREQAAIVEKFAAGKIDVLIGTHKLLQKDLKVHDLGLVIVDEEHRFGVRQKEQLKRFTATIDLLTMTATPIPRTLNMAMAGIRDLSIISTPPVKRLSVKTFVHEKQDSLLKEALLRELLRGGQVFYLHNDVSDIEKTASDIQALVPEAKIGIGHGQMRERELEQVMSDFYHKKYNVLVCTTIIETGIDIPNANTIIIERADKFGLAQLHQLRGRVGRSHHQAYAYLLIPNKKLLTRDAEKRLEAIAEAQDLGAGFILATHDLEIRGAGEFLGDEQSGQMQSIGFTLYLDMLEKAVNALKAGEKPNLDAPLNVMGEINLHLPALIPDSYLPDVHNRLMLYKRIANADTTEQLHELKVEMIDRFGLLTDEINNLFHIMQIKLACIPIGIEKIDVGGQGGYIDFASNTTIGPMTIVNLVQSEPQCYRLSGASRLAFTIELPDVQSRLNWVEGLIAQLAQAES